MADRTYTQEQIINSKRLMNMIASVPTDRQPEVIRLIEAVILGAEMADRLNIAAAERM